MVGVEEGREFRFRGDLYSQESREYFPSRFDLLWMCCRLQIVFTVVQQLTSFRVYRASCSPSAVVQLLVGTHEQADELPRLQYSHSTQFTAGFTLTTVLLPTTPRLGFCTFSIRQQVLWVAIQKIGWLGSRVVSVLDSGAEGSGFKSQSRRCRVTVLGKLFTPIVPLFTKQQNW